MSTPTLPGEAALNYAQRGWSVFPLVAGTKGRHPDGRSAHLLFNGHNGATSEQAQIRAWWQRWPTANIGLNLAASGLVALDADLYKPDCAWARLPEVESLPRTFTQESPNRGRHYVFTAPDGAAFAGQQCTGVDIKHNGYILLSPSVVDGRPYTVLDPRPPASCPPWIRRRAIEADTCGSSTHPAVTSLSELEELLGWVDPDAAGYDGWVEILQALHSATDGSADGVQIAETWSQRGAKFRPGEVGSKWKSFQSGGGVTKATLAHRAREAGADLGAIARRSPKPLAHSTRAAPRPTQQVPVQNAPSLDLSHDQLALDLGAVSFDADARFVAAEG